MDEDDQAYTSYSTSSSSSYTAVSSSQPTSQCATAECAAGLLPATRDNRSASEIDASLCRTVIGISATPVLAIANFAAGLGLIGTAIGMGGKKGLQELVCP